MGKFKNLFKKKSKNSGELNNSDPSAPNSDDFITIDSSQLQDMTNVELIEVIMKYDSELKQAIGSAQQAAKFEESNERLKDEIQSYKDHAENLQKYVQQLNRDSDDFRQQLEVKSCEIDLLQSKITSQEELLASYNACLEIKKEAKAEKVPDLISMTPRMTPEQEQELRELQIRNNLGELHIIKKSLESEIQRVILVSNSDKQELNKNKNDYEELSKEKQESDMRFYKLQIESDVLKRDMQNLQFQKESTENEVNFLRKSMQEKDQKYHKKQMKNQATSSRNQELTTSNTNMKHEIELMTSKHELELQKQKEDCERELNFKDEINSAKLANIEREIQEKTKSLDLATENASSLREKLNSISSKLADFTELQALADQRAKKIATLETELALAGENLEESNKKRELARSEVIRLNKQVQDRTKSQQPVSEQVVTAQLKLGEQEGKDIEYKLLRLIRTEFESLYKNLMQMMMKASTSRSNGEKIVYLLDTDEFSAFERRLNNVVSQVYEISENPQLYWPDESNVNRSDGVQPYKPSGTAKLFSWLTHGGGNGTTVPFKNRKALRPRRHTEKRNRNREELNKSN